MTVSLCMIVRDEEAALPTCLSSVRDFVDEMVIVDTGSRDRTLAIAQDQGAKVYPYVWNHDFAAARNASLQYAQGDWILVLDADEVLVPAVIPSLRQVMQAPDVLVINLLRQEVGATQAPYSLISRLFRRHPQIAFFRPYHELVDDSVAAILQEEPHWKIVTLPEVALHHTGYQPSAIAQRHKYDRARTLMERHLANHGDDAYLCNKLGALYLSQGEVAKARELLLQGLQSVGSEPALLYELHYHLGDAYSQLQVFAEAEAHYKIALAQPIAPPLKLAALNSWGNLLMAQGDAPQAALLYENMVATAPDFAVGHYNLGMALKAVGKLAAAIDHYQQAIQLNPTYAEAYQNLGVALLKSGRVPESLAAFRQAIDLHRQQGSPEADRLQQGLRQMGLF